MRLLLTGLDADGRSCLLTDEEVVTGPVPGMPEIRNAPLFATTECPPPPRALSDAVHIATNQPAGILKWFVLEHLPHEAGAETATGTVHTTDAVELVYVLGGRLDVVLDDGAHVAEQGDCVAVNGVAHALRGGPEGSTILVASIGTPPPAAGG
jgi:mannose-6-phosphate isomerase-like protein (cupin superfamily)